MKFLFILEHKSYSGISG